MANIYSLQLLRNTTQLYATREAALTALTGGTLPAGTQDGSPVLARYQGEDGKIYTLVGYYADSTKISGATGGTNMTVFDYEGNAEDIKELETKIGTGVTTANTVTAQLEALSGNSASDLSGTTSVEGAKRYADEKVRAGLDALDYTLAKDDNKVLVSVSQTNGKVSATSENITSVKLSGYAEGTDADIAATDTLGQALGKLQAQINAMDKTASSASGEVVITVEEADGKVTEQKSKIKDILLTGYVKGNGVTPIAETDTVNAALSKLENSIAASQSATTLSAADKSVVVDAQSSGTTVAVNIKSGENVIMLDNTAPGGIYTDIKLSAITPSDTTVREQYALIASDGSTKLGSDIKIYKDSAYKEIYLGTSGDTINTQTGDITKLDGNKQSLNYAYMKADGTYDLVKVDVSTFLVNSEFESGVTATNGIVHGVVDTASEKDGQATPEPFLTVGADGFKISGIKNEITRQINLLDAVVTGGTTAGTATSNHVQVIVGEADGKLTGVTVTETNIADKSKLEELSGKTFTVATSSNSSITTATTAAADGTVSLDLITDASKIKMSGFTADSSGFTAITEASSITGAVKAVETAFIDNEEVVSAALNDLNDRVDGEVAARKAVDGQTGQTYTANSGKKYISGATSLNDADIKLNDAIEAIGSGFIKDVKVNNVTLAETDNVVNVQITAGSTAANDANAIHVDTNTTTGAITLTLGTIDAGTY